MPGPILRAISRNIPARLTSRLTAPRQVYTVADLAKALGRDPRTRLNNIRRANAGLLTEYFAPDGSFTRPSASGNALAGYNNRPGDLLRLSCNNRRTLLIGDLHGNTRRLNEVLAKVSEDLKAGRLNLVFLGDAIHSEKQGQMGKTGSSRQLLKAIVMLKILHPEQVHFLRGNHDLVLPGMNGINDVISLVEFTRRHRNMSDLDFCKFLALSFKVSESILVAKKDGEENIFQGGRFLRDFIDSLRRESSSRVAELLIAYQDFFDRCPLAAVIEGPAGLTFAAHSPIIRGGLKSFDELFDCRDTHIGHQLLWNKRAMPGLNRKQTYERDDIVALLGFLAKQARKPVNIVGGHEPINDYWNYRPYEIVKPFTIIHGNVERSMGWVEIAGDGRYIGPQEIRTRARIA